MDLELDQLYEMINSSEDERERIELTNKYCYKIFKENHEEAERLVEENLSVARVIQYDRGIAIALTILGLCQLVTGKYDRGIFFLEEARYLFLKMENINNYYYYRLLNGLGICYMQQGQYSIAAEFLRNTLNAAEEAGDYSLLGKVYINLSTIYERINCDKESLEYAIKAEKLLRKGDKWELYVIALNNMADSYARLGQYEKALESIERAFSIALQKKRDISSLPIIMTGGEILIRLGRYEEAETRLLPALKNARDNSNEWNEASILFHLGKMYLTREQTYKGVRFIYKALSISRRNGYNFVLKRANRELYELYNRRKKYKKALTHLKEYHKIKKADFELNRNRSFRNIEADSLRKANERLKVLSTIGRKITENLKMDELIITIYESINSIMDSTIFGIALYNRDTGLIGYESFIENGEYLPPIYHDINSKNSLAAYCLREDRTVFINNLKVEYKNYLNPEMKLDIDKKSPVSALFCPLKVGDESIGVVTVQSYHKGSYSLTDMDSLKALSYNIAIAISNARQAELIGEKNMELQRLAVIDSLTGLFNRREFEKRIKELWEYSLDNCKCFSIIIIDADHFKQINDNYGHLAGDLCLRRLAKVLQESMDEGSDCLARYGGEEFIILMNRSVEKALKLANRIMVKVRNEEIIYNEQKIKLTISIGVSSSREKDFSSPRGPELLIDRADNALYLAKREGRDRVVQAE